MDRYSGIRTQGGPRGEGLRDQDPGLSQIWGSWEMLYATDQRGAVMFHTVQGRPTDEGSHTWQGALLSVQHGQCATSLPLVFKRGLLEGEGSVQPNWGEWVRLDTQ